MFAPKHRSHKRARAMRTGHARRFRPSIEALEDRRLLSTIHWHNRGVDDRFDDVFGSQAELARRVVDAAIDAWERVIDDFHYPDGSNHLHLNVKMREDGAGFGGSAQIEDVDGGRPRRGDLRIGRGDDLDGDGKGDGGRWFLDPTPNDSSEFTGAIVNAFAGDAQSDPDASGVPQNPAFNKADLFTLVAAELTHLVGITSNRDTDFQRDRFHTDTRVPDSAEGGGTGTFWVFQGPSIQHLMTSNNGGSDGHDKDRPVHSAGPGVPVFFGGQFYLGAEDTGNAGYELSRRYLVPNTMALILQDAYGYDITPPERFGTFYSTLNETTGELLVRDGPGVDEDVIRIKQTPDGRIIVSVNEANDVPGTGPLPGAGNLDAFTSIYDAGRVSSIRIQTDEAADRIEIGVDLLDVATLTAPVTISTSDGDDQIAIHAVNAGNVTVNAGVGTDQLIVVGSDIDDRFHLTRDSDDPDLTHLYFNILRQIDIRDVETLNAAGGPLFGAGNDQFVVDFDNNNPLTNMALVFGGGLGDDTLEVTANAFGGVHLFTATFSGDSGDDRIVAAIAGNRDLTLTNDQLIKPFSFGPSSVVSLAGVERAELAGSPQNNRLDASMFSAGSVILRGGDGGDELIGGPNDDQLYGEGGDDLLYGNGGDDTLDGGPGNDTMDGNGGDDTYLEAPGSLDRLIDSGGFDTLDFSAARSGIALDLTRTAGQVQTVDLAGNQIAFTGFFERVIGSAFDDRFFWGHTVAGQSILEMLAGAGDDQVIIDGTKALPGTSVSLIGQQGDDRFQIHLPLPGAGGNPPPNPPGDAGLLLSAIVNGERLHIVGTDRDEDIRVVARPDQLPEPCFDVGISDPVTQRLLAQITADNVSHFALDAAAGNDRISALLESAGLIAVPLVANLHGGAGDDQMFIDTQNNVSSFAWSVLADGGAGDDFLQTLGLTAAILLGGKGIDEVIGGNGRDVLIGGEDRDSITGGKGEDILIPGLTAFDANPDALRWIHTFWNSDLPFLERVEYLSGPSDAPFHLIMGESVFDDGADNSVSDPSLDDWLLLPCFVTNTNDSGPGSLREAIHCANMAALPGQAAIAFRIPPTDPNFVDVDSALPGGDPDPDAFVIAPVSELPPLDNVHGWGIILDGRTQTSFGGDTNPFGPEIVLVNGGGITEPPVGIGLSLLSDDNRVFGLNIQSCAEAGIHISGSRNWVAENYIGTDATGRLARGNGGGVVVEGFPISADDNRIGTNGDGANDEAERNLISGNGDGVAVFGFADRTIVAGNYLGTDATGLALLGNVSGVRSWFDTTNTRIGTNGDGLADSAERNLISGNRLNGVILTGDGHVVAGNYIGTDATGLRPLGNGEAGVDTRFGASHVRIGTDGNGVADDAERNVISGNSSHGVDIRGDNHILAGNYIGTDATGLAPIANALAGVRIAGSGHRIGTDGSGVADAAERNVIGGNLSHGVIVLGRAIIVGGNFIGTDVTGTAALPNAGHGVSVNGVANRIGTNDSSDPFNANERNVISGNTADGVHITGAGTERNVVAGNYIGVDATGSAALGNGGHGVAIVGGSQSNHVGFLSGGDMAASGNVISANAQNGVHIEGAGTDGNVVARNRIGTDAMGMVPLGNGVDGVRIIEFAAGNVIGMGAVGNLISGNGNEGIRIQNGAADNWVQGNFIGTDASGTLPLGNLSDGVAIVEAPNNLVGGGVAGSNLISANLNGVALQGSAAAGNKVLGNLIGTDVSGRLPLGNLNYGVVINVASNNSIGGTAPGERNIISANRSGVFIGSDVLAGESIGNQVLGNFIGVDITGAAPLPNGSNGVEIVNRARQNVVGTDADGVDDDAEGNVISANRGDGVLIRDAHGNSVAGNHIGTDVTGLVGLGNGRRGVFIQRGADNLVGGAKPTARNVISANADDGVQIQGPGTTGNRIQGNFVGTNVRGLSALPNRENGVTVVEAAGNLIGGATPGALNLISGNAFSGVVLFRGAVGNIVQGNRIGTDVDGIVVLANGASGVLVREARENVVGTDGDGVADAVEANLIKGNRGDGLTIQNADNNIVAGNSITMNAGHGVNIFGGAEANRIGTDGVSVVADSVEGNLIAGNTLDGVRIVGMESVRNTIRGNSIHSNGLLGIDLGGDGVTDNDARDLDTGPNQLQNYPVLAAALAEGTGTRVRGTLKSLPDTSFTIDFYANVAADPSGHGEGQRWLGAVMVTTNAGGTANFNHLLDISVEPGQFITATATEGPVANLGNTSEFSASRLVVKLGDRAPAPQVASAPEENIKYAAPGNARGMNRMDQLSVQRQAADHLFGWEREAGLLAETLSLGAQPVLESDADTSALAADALFALLAADEEAAWIDSNPFRRGRWKFA
jgi:hypothetical protein